MSNILYIIAGPNGAGKTTASKCLLPELWNCREFVNADEIARGLSPYNPEEMAIAAGRLQLERIDYLINDKQTFAIETTLATKSYKNLIVRARAQGYKIELIFFYLPSPDDAIERVRLRVLSGGHNIPPEVVVRIYNAGLRNLFDIYIPIVDNWSLFNNFTNPSLPIVQNGEIIQPRLFNKIKEQYG